MQIRRSLAFLLPIPFVALACTPHTHDDGHAPVARSETEPVELSLTAFGVEHLVFAAHAPLVKGARTRVIVHVTQLADGAPLASGPVALVASRAGAQDARFDARMESPGHFGADVVLPDAGGWTVRALVGANERIELGTIEVAPDGASLARPAASDPSAISFTLERQWETAMTFERVATRAITRRITAPARVAVRPGAEAHVTAPLAGRLVAATERAWPRPGEAVEAGEVLARVVPALGPAEAFAQHALELQQHQLRHELDLQQLEAERAQRSARVRLSVAQREVTRLDALLAAELGTEQELARVRADLELARAEEASAQSSLDSVVALRAEHGGDPEPAMPPLAIVAPIRGTVVDVAGVVGASVEAGTPLAHIVDASRVWIAADVAETDLASLRAPFRGVLRIPSLAATRDLASEPAFVSPVVDATARTVRVAWEAENPSGELRPGLVCEVDVETTEAADGLAVPELAIVRERGAPIVFVMTTGESFEKRRVELGERDRDRVRIVRGLAPGDVVVVRGASELRLAALSGGGIEAHHHH